MIVSTLHQFIFVAIPKTGTHAVRRALREHLGPNDHEQVGLFGRKQFPIPQLAQLKHGHLSLTQVRPYFRPQEFSSFFKFAFVRNPFDRFVSYCAFIARKSGDFDRDPVAVMRGVIEAPPWSYVLFQPQHAFISEGEKMLADYVGRVEEMQQSYDHIAERIGIETAPLERVNSSARLDYRQYYDQSLRDQVARLYARDLEMFGYEF